MGPLGKLTSKLKSQPKEPQRNGRHISEAKGEPREQNQTLVHVGSKTSDDGFALLDVQHITDLTDGHVDEKTRQAVTSVQEETCESLEKDRERYLHHSMVAGTFSPSEHGGFGDAKIKRSWRDGIHNLNMQKPLETLAHIVSPKSRNEFRLGEGSENSFAVPAVSQKAEGVYESSDLDSSSLSLSLGLNRIKTRSGPLYSDGKDMDHDHFVAGNNLLTGSRVVTGGMGNDVALSQNPRSKDLAPGEVALSNFDVMVGDWEVEFGKSSMLSDSHKLQLTNRRKAKCESQRLQRGSSGRKASNQSFIPTLGRAFDSNNNYAVNENERVVRMKSVHAVPKVSNKSDHRLEKKVPSTLISYLKHELQEGAEMEATVKQLDVIREGESPTFNQSVPSISHSRILKKWPKDIKSFSHELGPRGGRPHDVHRPHSDNDLEEILAALRARFNTAKGEVDAELQFFAAALIGILDRNTDSFPGWKENVEDLLVLAQRCTKLSPIDFRRECENIVHRLDERRQELPLGLLKQLHTRMLFILTRCTRLLQFQKETSPEEEGLHKVQQCLKGVPSVERALPSGLSKRGKGTAASNTLLPEAVEHSARSDAGILKLKLAKKHKLSLGKKKFKHQLSTSPKVCQYDSNRVIGLQKTSFTCESFELRDSEKRVSKEFEENSSAAFHVPWDHADERLLDESSQQGTCPYKHINKDSWPHWLDTEKEEAEFVICRICEEEILTSHLEPHSLRCSWADAGDCQGVNLDERLRMLADYLEKIAELSTPKSNHMATDDSPDGYKTTRLNPLDVADNASPRSHELPGKALDGRMDDTCVSDSVGVEELRGLSLINFKRLLGVKADQGLASSSAGSGTPRSTLTTPRTSQLDLLWAERNSFVEQEDTSQIYELASFARDIARKHYTEVGVLESLGACLEELHEFLGQNKIIDLTIDTFGKRIEKLLREKIHLFGSMSDARKADSLSGSFEDDGMSTDDGVQSFKSTPTHSSYNDRITIADFDILKLISRGAFGRVFLAKKRATGDNFAIKVLRKIDMIRKNAVENILAERDILISVRNPFVVRFFYSFTCRENLYLVMEYLIGGDLYSLLRKLGCLEENVARVYIAELVLALEYLHSLGVVHRDLKPDNILIAHDGHIKLTDFGLSKVGLINSTDDLSGPTTGGMLMEENLFENGVEHGMQREYRKERSAVGTPDYLAPEILLGTEHGYTADWWSVGVILFELTTGLPPFNAEHPQIIFDNILNRKIPWPCVPEEMSQDAKDLIDKLLTEDPNQRLGAKGAAEVKNHPFFKDISWDNLARQKAAFVPSPESVDDTSYFTCRHQEVYLNSSPRFGDSSDCSTTCSSSNSFKAMLNEGEDDFGELQEFERSPSVERTFNNFSFKNASQLAYMNYDILSQSGRDATKGHSRHQSAS